MTPKHWPYMCWPTLDSKSRIPSEVLQERNAADQRSTLRLVFHHTEHQFNGYDLTDEGISDFVPALQMEADWLGCY
jgi:hypothetical protein